MENSNVPSRSRFLIPLVFTTLGMVVFAGLYFLTPSPQTKTTTVTQTVTTTVTNTVFQEVPKEVEKIVNVPAEIPPEYQMAMNVYRNITNATFVSQDNALFNLSNVRVEYILSDDVKERVSEEEVKAKFELALRRNNVPIYANSTSLISVKINGLFNDETKVMLSYSVLCTLNETQWIFRSGQCHMAIVQTWSGGYTGFAGKLKANDQLLDAVEKEAEQFANDYLSANPK
jgi:hypothetical protein